MGFGTNGEIIIERHAELCLHLRLRTRGDASTENIHPLKVTDRFHLMHNGTLRLPARVASRSDSWHLAMDLLRPLAAHWPNLPIHSSFQALVEAGLTPENKLVLLDAQAQRLIFFNRHHGAEFEGLWLSSTRWIDRRRLPLTDAPQPQQKTYSANELEFI